MNSSPTQHLTVADSYKQTTQKQVGPSADRESAREVLKEQVVSYENKARELREKLDEWASNKEDLSADLSLLNIRLFRWCTPGKVL